MKRRDMLLGLSTVGATGMFRPSSIDSFTLDNRIPISTSGDRGADIAVMPYEAAETVSATQPLGQLHLDVPEAGSHEAFVVLNQGADPVSVSIAHDGPATTIADSSGPLDDDGGSRTLAPGERSVLSLAVEPKAKDSLETVLPSRIEVDASASGEVQPAVGDQAGTHLFVSPEGNDANSGTKGQPFATLEAARDAIREMDSLPSGGVTVNLREGEYRLKQSFKLGKQDSGGRNRRITYRAYQGEDVRITGGKTLPTEAWNDVSGDGASRIPEAIRNEVKAIDVSEMDIDLGDLYVRGGLVNETEDEPFAPEIYYDGKVQTLARWPNEGWAHIDNIEDNGGWYNVFGDRVPIWTYDHENRPETWEEPQKAWVYGYLGKLYSDQRLQIDSIEPEARRITTVHSNLYPLETGHKYYYFNILEELDVPGEYYIDRDEEMIYFYPPGDIADATVEISQFSGTFFELNNASNITIYDLQFQTSRGDGISMQGGKHNRIQACTFSGMAGRAASINSGEDGSMSQDNGIHGCDIFDTGDGAGGISGGDRASLTPANNFATNNYVENFARINRTYRGFSISGVGNRLAHNEITEAHGSAITGGSFNECIIEYNHIHQVMQEASDGGAFYCGRNPTDRGQVLRYNYIHDVHSGEDKSEVGIYLDDRESGFTLHGNILMNCDLGFLIGGGRDNVITNNLMLHCNKALSLDKRGLTWGTPDTNAPDGCYDNEDFSEHFNDFDLQSEPWKSKYPALADYAASYPDMSKGPLDAPCAPQFNVVKRNVVYNCDTGLDISTVEYDWGTVQAADRSDNLITSKSLGFSSPSESELTFQFGSDSRVRKQISGWESIPFENVGLQQADDNPLRSGSYDITESANQFVWLKAAPTGTVALDNSVSLAVEVMKYDGSWLAMGEGLSQNDVSIESRNPDILTVSGDGTLNAKTTGQALLKVMVAVEGVGDIEGYTRVSVAESASSFVTPADLQTFAKPGYTVKNFTNVQGPPFTMDGVISGYFGVGSGNYGTIYAPGGMGSKATVVAKLSTWGPTGELGNQARTGIFAQNDLEDPSSPGSAAIAVKKNGDIHFMWDTTGEGSGFQEESVVSPGREIPIWLKLTRDGTTFTGSYSTNGTDWTEVGSADVSTAATVQDVGLAAAGHTGYNSSGTAEYTTWQIAGIADADFTPGQSGGATTDTPDGSQTTAPPTTGPTTARPASPGAQSPAANTGTEASGPGLGGLVGLAGVAGGLAWLKHRLHDENEQQ